MHRFSSNLGAISGATELNIKGCDKNKIHFGRPSPRAKQLHPVENIVEIHLSVCQGNMTHVSKQHGESEERFKCEIQIQGHKKKCWLGMEQMLIKWKNPSVQWLSAL